MYLVLSILVEDVWHKWSYRRCPNRRLKMRAICQDCNSGYASVHGCCRSGFRVQEKSMCDEDGLHCLEGSFRSALHYDLDEICRGSMSTFQFVRQGIGSCWCCCLSCFVTLRGERGEGDEVCRSIRRFLVWSGTQADWCGTTLYEEAVVAVCVVPISSLIS